MWILYSHYSPGFLKFTPGFFFFFLFNPLHFAVKAQVIPKAVEISGEESKIGYKFYASNENHCAVSLIFSFDAVNICGLPTKRILVEANVQKQFLFEMKLCDLRKDYKFEYKCNTWLGDTELSSYDSTFIYTLPFPKGKAYKVSQGYFGIFSHQHLHALDFEMPEGSSVCAMRDGIVVCIKNNSRIGYNHSTSMEDANFILIYHKDGTFAIYGHLMQKGNLVAEGERVQQGQVIAYSGNTGWSSGPHLHVVVFSYKPGENFDIRTYSAYFKEANQAKTILQEGRSYTSIHP